MFIENNMDINRELRKLNEIHDEIKEKVFGKVKFKKKSKDNIIKLQAEKIKLMETDEMNEEISEKIKAI